MLMIYVYSEKTAEAKIAGGRKGKRRLVMLLSIATAFLICFMLFVRFSVNPMIVTQSEAKVRTMTNKSISSAITQTIKENIAYTDLITISRNADGKITMMQTNTLRINLLARTASEQAQKNLERAGKNGIAIPIGSLTGIPIFAGKGSSINIRVVPVGAVVCTFKSEFFASGINQTLHKIYINVEATVNVILPGENKKLDITQEILLCENLFIGEIPGVYLQTSNLDEALNLVPSP